MADYSQHRLQNYEWYYEYRFRMGNEDFDKYLNRVYALFIQIKPGSFFDIRKNVKEENCDLFIKLCCMFIDETRRHPIHAGSYYEFSNDFTILKCISQNRTKKTFFDNRKAGCLK